MTRPSLAQQAGVPDLPVIRVPPVLAQHWTVYCADQSLIVSLRPDGRLERGTGSDVLLEARARALDAPMRGLALALLRARSRAVDTAWLAFGGGLALGAALASLLL